jgi:hypothetical protein
VVVWFVNPKQGGNYQLALAYEGLSFWVAGWVFGSHCDPGDAVIWLVLHEPADISELNI